MIRSDIASCRFLAALLLAVAVVPMYTGCGDGLASVNGTVTLDGKPIEGGPRMYGTVSFYREDGSGAPAVGIIESAGKYTLKTGAMEGVAPGAYLVSIAVKKITMPTDPNAMPQPTLITPKKYTSVNESGLRADVEPGSNTFDFPLKTAGQ